MDRADISALVRSLLESERFAVLSTVSASGPRCSLVAFWAAEDLSHAVFATMRSSRKFASIGADGRVSMLFDDRANAVTDVRRAAAVGAVGFAREIVDRQRWSGLTESLVAKHPDLRSFVDEPDCVLVRVDFESFQVVTELQNVETVSVNELRGSS